jgi:hypothetical protein
VATTLPDLPTVSEERRNARVRVACLVVVALFVLAGLVGALGVRSDTVSAADGPLEVEVTYPSRARPALAVPIEVTITRDGGFDGPVEVSFSTGYLESFDENGTNPAPDSATTDADETIWTYQRPEGETFTIWIDTRVEPGVQWRREGRTTVRTGGDAVSVDYTSWILP